MLADITEHEYADVWQRRRTTMNLSPKGYFDISEELLASLCSITQGKPPGYLIRVTNDPVPSGATVSHIEGHARTIRVWLDGAEQREYRPQFTAYYPRDTTARLVMIEAKSRDEAEQDHSIPRVGEFDGVGTVCSIESAFVKNGRYEVRINYE